MTSSPIPGFPAVPGPLVIGHRGASGYRPEHSRSAYELALALGAEALEPDLVATRDGVLVLRHENEISGTTDVAAHPEFADRRTVKVIDGDRLDGWFTEDFDWAELQTLTVRERIPQYRPQSASFDGRFPILRLADLVELVARAVAEQRRPIGLVLELKHASHFASVGLPLDRLLLDTLAELGAAGGAGPAGPVGVAAGIPIIVESFELPVLLRLREAGLEGHYVFLAESTGAPADEVLARGASARSYAEFLSDDGLARLAREVHGVSVDKRLILPADAKGVASATTDLVARAHDAGLTAFTWTLRPENVFLPKSHRLGSDRAAHGQWAREFSEIMATGLDGVFADHPDLALSIRDSLGG